MKYKKYLYTFNAIQKTVYLIIPSGLHNLESIPIQSYNLCLREIMLAEMNFSKTDKPEL